MTMKQMKSKAAEIKADFTFQGTSGNDTYKNDFYVSPTGSLWNIQYKLGKLNDVICYGR